MKFLSSGFLLYSSVFTFPQILKTNHPSAWFCVCPTASRSHSSFVHLKAVLSSPLCSPWSVGFCREVITWWGIPALGITSHCTGGLGGCPEGPSKPFSKSRGGKWHLKYKAIAKGLCSFLWAYSIVFWFQGLSLLFGHLMSTPPTPIVLGPRRPQRWARTSLLSFQTST